MFAVSQIILAMLRNTDFVIQECVASVNPLHVSAAISFSCLTSIKCLRFASLHFIESQNHRMAWVEKDRNDHPVPTPCYVQGHQPADQAAQSHIQPGLECLQGWWWAGTVRSEIESFSCSVGSHCVTSLRFYIHAWLYTVNIMHSEELAEPPWS